MGVQNAEMGVQGAEPRRIVRTQSEFDQQFGHVSEQQQAPACKSCRFSRSQLSCSSVKSWAIGRIPILGWLPKYDIRSNLVNDVIGGLTVAIMHIPQGMAYATLSGLRPVNGLYTALFPALFYMLFGTSRHISIGVFAVVSLMAGSCNMRVSTIFDASNSTTSIGQDEADYALSSSILATLTLTVGLVQFSLGALRLDFLTSLLSDQVVTGFTTGAAFHVLVAQFDKLLSVKLARHSGFLKIYHTITAMADSCLKGEANGFTALFSAVTIVLLFSSKNFLDPVLKKVTVLPVPYDLFVVVLGTLVSAVFQFQSNFGIKVLGDIPTGLPAPQLPDPKFIPYVINDALGISVVSLVVTVSMAKLFAKKHDYRVDFRQEFLAIGLSSGLSSLFPVWPSSTALARTLVYEAAGTKTQLATLFASLLIVGVLYWIGPLLAALPICFLSCIIVVALQSMFRQLKELPRLWRLNKTDFAVFLVTFLATVLWDVVEGLAIGVVFSMLLLVFRVQRSKWTELGEVVDSSNNNDAQATPNRYFVDRSSYVDSKPMGHGARCLKLNAPLIFCNVDALRKFVHGIIEETRAAARKTDTSSKESRKTSISDQLGADVEMLMKFKLSKEFSALILDMSSVDYIDVTGANVLVEADRELATIRVPLILVGLRSASGRILSAVAREKGRESPPTYPSIGDAVGSLEGR